MMASTTINTITKTAMLIPTIFACFDICLKPNPCLLFFDSCGGVVVGVLREVALIADEGVVDMIVIALYIYSFLFV